MSQLTLALEAGISSRHLSYVETGKAQPSREMVARLADTLEMPLRERNALLVAAGYAPRYRETALSMPELTPVRQAVEQIVRQQEPFPAFVLNRYWDVMLVNDAMVRIFNRIKPGGPKHGNVLRQIFDPEDMRPYIGNWDEVAGEVIRHLHNDVAAAPSDERARTQLREVLAYPGIPERLRSREPNASSLPLLTTVLRNAEVELTFFSTLSTFGTTHDVTIEELRIECMFPANEATGVFCRSLVG
jgi:transcriptional regulator with XRE-family HTH domain